MGSDLRWVVLGLLYDPVGNAGLGIRSGFDVGPAAIEGALKAAVAQGSPGGVLEDPAGAFEAYFRHVTGIRAAVNDLGVRAVRSACAGKGMGGTSAAAVLRAWMCATLARREDSLGLLRHPRTRRIELEDGLNRFQARERGRRRGGRDTRRSLRLYQRGCAAAMASCALQQRTRKARCCCPGCSAAFHL